MRTPGRRAAALCLLALLVFAARATSASAGTYPMSQCGAGGTSAVAATWSAYGGGGMFNGCGAGGGWGLWTYDPMGYNTTAGLTTGVPASHPNVTIQHVDAGVATATQGDEPAFLRWFAGGQVLVDREMTGWSQSLSRAPAAGTRDFTMDVYCTYARGPVDCHFSDRAHVVTVGWLVFTLADDASPGGGASGGTLVTPGPRRGTETLSWTATDKDSGVKAVDVRLGSASVGSYAFDAACSYTDWSACPNGQSRTLDVDTTRVPDGTYPLRLVVTDAAGNTAAVDAGRVTIANDTAPDGARAALAGGSSPAAASDCNGSVCADRAQLTSAFLDSSTQLRVRYGRPAKVTGRLTTISGEPIAGARLDATAIALQPGDPDRSLGQVVTDGEGRWAYDVPPGPSRTVRFGWRARNGAASYAERTEVRLLVIPRVTVRPTAKTIRRGGRVTLAGRVLGGPYPSAGVLVTLQGRPSRGGRWRTFGVTRTRGEHGRFRRSYRFQSASRGRFVFRARVAVQAGYPYLAASSRAARARVR
jgi:hypothetical protein